MGTPHWIWIPVILLAFSLSSCSKKKEVARAIPLGALHALQFNPYDASRVIVDSLASDMDTDGIEELVLTSRDVETPVIPSLVRQFDRIELFVLDTSSGIYASAFVDPVDGGSSIDMVDVTNNGRKELVVITDLGGNDPLTSRGMNIYGSRAAGGFTVLFFSEQGNPELRDLNGDGIPEVLISTEYYGIMPHAEGIGYISEIHAYDGDLFLKANQHFGRYFDAEIAQRRTEYGKARNIRGKEDEDAQYQLYRAFASLVLWIDAKGDIPALRRLWQAEKAVLAERLSKDLFNDLDGLVQELLMTAQTDGLKPMGKTQI